MPELRHLRVFVAVAEERNFTRAAERLHLAQQAVSRTVAGLEAELGVALLERTTREVSLTPAGEALLEDATGVLAAADAAFARAGDVGAGRAGRVTVGATPAVGPEELDPAIAQLRADLPDLAVALHAVRPREIADALAERRLDLVLARTAAPLPGVVQVSLRPTPAGLAVVDDDALAGRDAVTLADLDGRRLLVHSAPGTPFTDLVLALCAAAGARVEPVESRVTGGGSFVDLRATGAVSLVPGTRGAVPGHRVLPLADGTTLPLLGLRPAGRTAPAVDRLVAALGA